MEEFDLIITAVVATLTLALLIVAAVLLLVTSSNRRNRHRAELAELIAKQDRELLEKERETIKQTLREVARELHDNLGQLITVAQVGVKNVLQGVIDIKGLIPVRDALEQGITEVRRLGHDINSDLWESRTLIKAITAEAERIEQLSKLKVIVSVIGIPQDPTPGSKTILFRIFQEIVTNAIKHGKPSEITIVIDGASGLRLTISDNGQGFEKVNVRTNAGLTNIHKRCAMIGFHAICTTSPGAGCRWQLQPLDHAS